MARLATTVENTPHSGIRRMAELARQIPDAIRLDAGDPSFNTAPHICDAALAAMSAGYTTYTPSGGYSTLRSLIAERVSAQRRTSDAATADGSMPRKLIAPERVAKGPVQHGDDRRVGE